MSLSHEAFERLSQHWAVGSIGNDELERADNLVNERLAFQALGEQIAFSFSPRPDDDSLLERAAVAYEIAAIEGLDELSLPAGGNKDLRDQGESAACKAFEIRRLMDVPSDTEDRLFFILKLSALAYCGDRWSDLQWWCQDKGEFLIAPSMEGATWDRRLLYQLFNCWVRLFRKQGWDDIQYVCGIISDLRRDQKLYEPEQLNDRAGTAGHAMAFRLAALYHWVKGTEILVNYIFEGQSSNPLGEIAKHFDAAQKNAMASGDVRHEIIVRWLYASARVMITNSLWWATRTIGSRTSEFVHSLTHREHQAMFELLPPQRAALLEKNLLDPAKTAIVVDLPTSGGKTLLAQFRILQALEQFGTQDGWIAYVAPTRALSAQIARRQRKDFEPIGLRVEQLTAAVEVDSFEDDILSDARQPFQILVATPEKFSLVIRNKKISRPLALVVMDEAHNLETEGRGLRIELLLATIKRDCSTAKFLLLMPFAEDAESVVRWLAQDMNAGQAISLGTTPWKPNERVVGIFRAVEDGSVRAGWKLGFRTLSSTPRAMPIAGEHPVGGVKPLDVPKSSVISKGRQKGLGLQTAAMSGIMSERGTSLAVANSISTVWTMARKVAENLGDLENPPEEIVLVQNFLRSEIGPDYELVGLLNKGVGIHHAGLSDDARALMEWLVEERRLRVLCATTTIAQGLNFPVSSVFLQTCKYAYGNEMSPREFWNLAGRAGRIGHENVGVVGLAAGNNQQDLIDFVHRNTGELVSRLVKLVDTLVSQGRLNQLTEVLHEHQWEDFRCYVAHLWAEKESLDAVLADTDQLLRHTYGYATLRNDPEQRAKADALLDATQNYARSLAENPGRARLADATGFSPEGVAKAMSGIRDLPERLTVSDWAPESLFGTGGKMADLFGVMLKVPQLKGSLEEIAGNGVGHAKLSDITRDWVNGVRIDRIAARHFADTHGDEDSTAAISRTCRAIYKVIVNNGTWGLSALNSVSEIDFESLTEKQRRRMNALPAMIYHGVRTEDAVLMRMNSVPRSAAESLGRLYRNETGGDRNRFTVGDVRDYLRQLDEREWHRARPQAAALSGDGYRQIWQVLAGGF